MQYALYFTQIDRLVQCFNSNPIIRINILGIFNKSTMGKAIKNGHFNMPPPQCIPQTDLLAPFVIVGDQAFPLLVNLMRPFPENQSIGNSLKEEFNYRLSRARRVSENAFGISTSLFTIFTKPFDIRCDATRNDLIFSTCLLHNLIRDENEEFFLSHQTNNVQHTQQSQNNANNFDELENSNTLQLNTAIQTRNTFVQYFSTIGVLSWRKLCFEYNNTQKNNKEYRYNVW